MIIRHWRQEGSLPRNWYLTVRVQKELVILSI